MLNVIKWLIFRRGIKPEFDREAAAVLHSPYFYQRPDFGGDFAAELAWGNKRREEKTKLIMALRWCHDYRDLGGKAKAVYDRARATLKPE